MTGFSQAAKSDARWQDIAKAKAILKVAARYLDLRDADRAAQLLQQAEQIVTALAKERALRVRPTQD